MAITISSFSRRIIPVLAILALGGCSDLNIFELFDDDTPSVQVASHSSVRARSDAEQARSENSDTPSLTSVPKRPATGSSSARDQVVEGLIADRNKARYTDEAIRLQSSARPAEAPQAASAPTPSPVPNAPPAQISLTPMSAQPAPTTAEITAAGPVPATAVSRPVLLSPPAEQIANVPSPLPSPFPTPTFQSSTSASPLVSSSSSSVNVDTSVIDGGSRYLPLSAQIRAEAQVATIQFGLGSSELSSRDHQVINAVAAAYRNGGRLLVVGHASGRTGQMPKNRHKLVNFNVSFDRANAVAQALIRVGVPPERVSVEAVSDDQPIYSESMPTGEAGNRRAEIYVLQ